MRIKTYRGPSTTQVLAQIKSELGADAVILSTQTVSEDGRNVCEVMAAVEPAAGNGSGYGGNGDGVRRPAGSALQPGPSFGPAGAGEGAWLREREWDQIKDHLMALMGTRMDLTALAPRQRLAVEYLEREGVDRNVLLTLWRRLKEDAGCSVLSVLGEMVGIRPFTGGTWAGKYHGLAGPHGSGKTTSLIRLALLHKRLHPGERILVANGDDNQGRGRLFLRHYAELSGLAYREIEDDGDFAALRTSAGGYDRVFIDLPGLGDGANMEEHLRRMGMDREKDLSIHLVLSPYYAPAQYGLFLKKFSAREGSLIWTKLDEACNYGAIINVSAASGLPVSALSYGPGLRGSLAAAEGPVLWRLVFKHQLPSGEDNSPPARRTESAVRASQGME